MQQQYRYLKSVLRHKWFVMLECWKYGLYWQGIIHDLSKFYPSEFIPYSSYKFPNGDGNTADEKQAFDVAWLKHQRRNPHHWQYWILKYDDGHEVVLEMPERYVLEMIADWRGAGLSYGNPNTRDWYLKRRDTILLHPKTRDIVERELRITLWARN